MTAPAELPTDTAPTLVPPDAPPPQVWPTLRARDARSLIRFLVEAFGFEETAVYGEGDVVHHAELALALGRGNHARVRSRDR